MKANRNVKQRDLPLFECNILVDVSKPIRKNVEALLATMGNAKLVWSQGKYKLQLQYPATNGSITVAGVLTDDDIALDKTTEIAWPSAGDRVNYATVRFLDEANNFKQNSASWPPKTNLVEKRGVGSKKFVTVGGWTSRWPGGAFLNNYGVWDGGNATTTMVWLFSPRETGNYNLQWTVDNKGSVTIKEEGGPTYTSTSPTSGDVWHNVIGQSIPMIKNKLYTITIAAINTGDNYGVGGRLVAPTGVTEWTTRGDSYSAMININQTSEIYDQLLAEDNGIQMESDDFVDGITDYYHALAKAEEKVRTSRLAATLKIEYFIRNRYYEPGDILKIESETLQLGDVDDFYITVDSVKVQESSATAEIVGTRFDSSFLAWNVKDNVWNPAPNIYSFVLDPPMSITYVPENNALAGSTGTLYWPASASPGVQGYILYFHEVDDLNASGMLNWREIGRTTANYFFVPDLGQAGGLFGVRAFTSNRISLLVRTVDAVRVDELWTPPAVTNLAVSLDGDYDQATRLTWTVPSERTAGFAYLDHSHALVYRAKVPSDPGIMPDYVYVGTSVPDPEGDLRAGSFIDNTSQYGELRYKIRLVSTRELTGPASNPADITIDPNNIASAKTAIVYAYKRAPEAPTDSPGQVTYNFPSGGIVEATLANEWSKTIPSGQEALWVVVATAFNAADTDVITEPEWSDPTLFVTSGINTATVFLYQKSNLLTPPAVPSDGAPATYTFSSGNLTPIPTGWVRSIKDAGTGKYLWVTQATAISVNTSDTITDAEWSAPVLFAAEGFDSIILDLTSESDIVGAGADGLGYVLPDQLVAKLYQGTAPITSGVTFSGSATKNGLTLNINAANGNITLSGAAWTSNSEQFLITAVYNGVSYQNTYSIAKSKAGADAVLIDLVYDAEVVAAETNGTGYVLPSSNQISLWKGGVKLTTGVTYGPASTTQNGLIATVNVGTGAITWSGGSWTTDRESFTFSALYKGVTYTIGYTVSKSKRGIQGVQGLQGVQGIQGPVGNNGLPIYFHVKYSNDGGASFTSANGETPGSYIGTYSDYTAADSNSLGAYTWVKVEGAQGPTGNQGIKGDNGVNGQTAYLHIKYSNNGGASFTAANGETPGDWIGTYVDFTAADSMSLSAYTWAKIKGDNGATGATGAMNFRIYIAGTMGSPPGKPGNTTNGGTPGGWSASPVTLTIGQTQFQSDGVQGAGSSVTSWNTPYPSYFKVGSLDAITATIGMFRSAPVGSSRVEISDSVIKVYEGSSKRVQIGDLNA